MSKYIIFGLGLTILLMSVAGYFYYNSTQAEIKQLNRDIATSQANELTLKGTVAEQNQSIIRLENIRNTDQSKIIDLSGKLSDARKESEEIKKKFAKHDLNRLSISKPGLIEKIINKGTKKVHKELEALTAPEKIDEN